MNIGALRHLVTLDVPDGQTGGYLPLSPPSCFVAVEALDMERVTLIGRAHRGITTATRVHLKGRTYHVDSVVTRGDRDVEMVLHCTEVFD